MNKKHLTLLLLITTFLFTLILVIACDDSPNGPEDPPPGRRDYEWDIQKIEHPNLLYTDIWGSDTNNVWAASLGSPKYNLIRFNGENWEHPEQNFMYGMY